MSFLFMTLGPKRVGNNYVKEIPNLCLPFVRHLCVMQLHYINCTRFIIIKFNISARSVQCAFGNL